MNKEQDLFENRIQKIGNFSRGEKNSITDIRGVRVGHLTVNKDIADSSSKKTVNIRTGLTAVLPYPMEKEMRLFMEEFILKGAKETTGYQVTKDFCYLNSPVVITNSYNVGAAYDAILSYGFSLGRAEIWPPFVVGIDDFYLNGMRKSHLDEKAILDVFLRASTEQVEEGSVGIGLGMRAFDSKGGIGTASRKFALGIRQFHCGILAVSGHGNRRLSGDENSLTIIAAVDIPLVPYQIRHITEGLVFNLSSALNPTGHTDALQCILFTTANPMSMENEGPFVFDFQAIDDAFLPEVIQAGSEAIQEAILRSLIKADPVQGKQGRICETIPSHAIEKIIKFLG
jgi:D-aminopeptidase